ncbi:MAG: DUF1801 domain-containing protein [Candidatus Woesearchaeota archaeon]
MAYELKTKKNDSDVSAFIETLPEKRQKDCKELVKLMKKITKEEPKMWGKRIVGFGSYHYKYASGQEGNWMLIGFSPRNNDLSIYTMCDINTEQSLLDKLGKHKHGKSCLYIKRLSDIDKDILQKILENSIEYTLKTYAVN